MTNNIHYKRIKELAKRHSLRVTDLIALAPKNDPMYMGRPSSVRDAEWFAEIWQRAGFSRGHLRRVHYWAQSRGDVTKPDGTAYENTDRDWAFMTEAGKAARYLRLVPVDAIEDHRNPPPKRVIKFGSSTPIIDFEPPDIMGLPYDVAGFTYAPYSPVLMGFWAEKSTVDDIIGPVAEMVGAEHVTFLGESSIPACHAFVERVARSGKEGVLFYISDFDAAGAGMPIATARKIEWLLAEYGVANRVRVQQVALTKEQVEGYDLPVKPMKEKERRRHSFKKRFGVDGAVELDAIVALHGGGTDGALGRILLDAATPFVDWEKVKEVAKTRRRLIRDVRRAIDGVIEDWSPVVEAIDPMWRALERAVGSIELGNYGISASAMALPEDEGAFFFDSKRSYLSQIIRYKQQANRPVRFAVQEEVDNDKA